MKKISSYPEDASPADVNPKIYPFQSFSDMDDEHYPDTMTDIVEAQRTSMEKIRKGRAPPKFRY
jgi:hypothetical protein